MKLKSLFFVGAMACAAMAIDIDIPSQRFRPFGTLPEFTPGAGAKQNYRIPMAVDMGGRLPDLLLQADSRLWFYINESKRGKILFSEPIVLKSVENQDVETAGAAVLQGNELIIRRPDGSLIFAAVVGDDVPMLRLGQPVPGADGKPVRLEEHHFLLVPGVDGEPELLTENGTRKGVRVNGELRFESPVCVGLEWVVMCCRFPTFYSPTDGHWKAAELSSGQNGGVSYITVADFDGDSVPDMVQGGDGESLPRSAVGVKTPSAK